MYVCVYACKELINNKTKKRKMSETVVSTDKTPSEKLWTEPACDEWETEGRQREIRAAQLAEDNIRLKTRQSQLQDQLEEARRQLSAERNARQGLVQELGEAKERLQRAKDNFDKKKREHGEISLQLCTVTAERDDLEAKVNEAWHRIAAVEGTARAKDIENKALQEALDNERKERAAQEVLMNAMVAQLAALEQQVAEGAGAGEQQRRLGEEALQGVKEEVQHLASVLEYLADMSSTVSSDQLHDRHMLLLGYQNKMDEDGGSDTTVHGVVNVGLNTSDPEKASQDELRLKTKTRVLGPIYQAVRHLRQQLQRQRDEQCAMQRDRRVLESHIAALKDELRYVGNNSDDVRERLLWSEAQREQMTETLQSIRHARDCEAVQATETRGRIAALLHCLDDWCIIEQYILDLVTEVQRLQSALQESRKGHEAYVTQKENELDAVMDSHQREMNTQKQRLEQARHECEQLKRAAAVAAIVVNSDTDGSLAESRRELEVFKMKHQEMLRYVEGELEPLMQDQAKALEEERQRVNELRRANDTLRLELKLVNSVQKDTSGRISLFEALVLTLRVLSGAMADLREMAQQRTALTRHILAYERMFGGFNVWGESVGPPPLLRFRRAVVAVLALHRLVALQRAAWRRGGVIPLRGRGAGRIRLPPETCCLVRGGLVRLPPVVSGESVVDHSKDERGEAEEGSGVVFVAEQDLRLPVLTCRAGYNDVITQGHVLHGCVDDLLSFVTVPSRMWPRHSVKESLSWRLTNGLRALQRSPLSAGKRHVDRKPQRLLHLPPRAPGRTSVVAPFWCESSPSVLPAAAQQLPDDDDDREGPHTLSKMTARRLLSSMGRAQEFDAGRGASAYPVPKPNASDAQSTWDLEESLYQSLLRDAENNNGLQESQMDNGFASQVLNAIHALDQRVLGALERNTGVGGRRPQR